MRRFRLAVLIGGVYLAAGCGPADLVTPDQSDMTDPDPVEIHGRLTGGGYESNNGLLALGDLEPGPLTLLPNTGQLEITSTATDRESGIKKFDIISNDRRCNFVDGTWRTTGMSPTKTRVSRVITADSSGKVRTTVVALVNIQVGAELAASDKVTMQFVGVATNFANKSVNIGRITYTAVSGTVPDANKLDACP